MMRLLICLSTLLFAFYGAAQQWEPYHEHGGRTGWTSPNGKVVIPASDVIQAGDRWLITTRSGKKGMIASDGRLVLDTVYTSLETVGDSLIAFSLRKRTGSIDTLVRIDAKKRVYTEPKLLIPDNRFGLMDLEGKIVLQPAYARFRTTKADTAGDYLVVYEQMLPVEKQHQLLNLGEQETYISGLISRGGTILTPLLYSDFYRANEHLYIGVLPFDHRFFRETYLIPQSRRSYQGNSCIVTSYQPDPQPVYNYYPRLVIYDNRLGEITRFRGHTPHGDPRVIYGTDHAYYFVRDKLIDSVAIERHYHAGSTMPVTVAWKNDPCGYGDEANSYGYSRDGSRRSPMHVKDAYGSLYSIYTDRGHCLLNERLDTVLFSAENHFFRMPRRAEIHVRTCEGKWGLADTLGKVLVATISDSIIFRTAYFSKIILNGREVWLDQHFRPVEAEDIRILIDERFAVGDYEGSHFPFFLARSLETGKYGLIDTSGKLATALQYDRIFSSRSGFWVYRKEREGFIAFDGQRIRPVTYRRQLVTDRIAFSRLRSAGKTWEPVYRDTYFLVMKKGEKQGIISLNKKVLLRAKKRSISPIDRQLFLVTANRQFSIFNASLEKFVAGPFPVNDYEYFIDEGSSGKTIIIMNRTGEVARVLSDGTKI